MGNQMGQQPQMDTPVNGIPGMGQNIQQMLQQRFGPPGRGPMPLPGSTEQRPGYGPGLPPGGMPGMPGQGGQFGIPQNPFIPPGQGGMPPGQMPEMPGRFNLPTRRPTNLPTQVTAAMPAGPMPGGMNPVAQQLQQTGANPAVTPTVTGKIRPTSKSDMSSGPPKLKFSNPIQTSRKVAAGPLQSQQQWLQNAQKKFGAPQTNAGKGFVR